MTAKKKPMLIPKDTKIVKYITRKVDIEIHTEIGAPGDGISTNLKATFDPRERTVRLENVSQLNAVDLTFPKLRVLGKAFIDLADVIERQDKLRELAEGFGDAITAEVAKKK